MKIPSIIFLVLFSAALATGQSKMVVGYYPSWGKAAYPYTSIPFRNLTHIAHAFVFPQSDGSLDLSGFTFYPEMIQAAHLNGVGVVISVGGYDVARTPRFAQVAADPAARTRFANALRDFCMTYQYDGVDIDWEYPVSSGRANTTLFFQAIRSALSGAGAPLTLSIAAASTDWNGGYDWSVMPGLLDWIGVMTYDFYGSWSPWKAGPNSPLYAGYDPSTQGSIQESVTFYKNKGVPPAKILIGTPFYGWQFNAAAVYGTCTTASQKAYSAIAPLIQQGWTRSVDAKAHVPFLVSPTLSAVVSYDDSISIGEKMTYVRSQGIGGTIIWALGQDNMGNGQQPLLRAVSLGLGLTTGVPEQTAASVPRTPELNQNYPNPFNGQTRISYSVAAAGRYTLRLYDLLGRQVEQLVNAEHQPGNYQVSCSSQSLPSGVYVYRLSGEGVTAMRTMIVLR
jgi:GH18 family chitinase